MAHGGTGTDWGPVFHSASGQPPRREPLLAGRGWLVAVALLALLSLLLRPLLPVDETRYLTVAWEMWDKGQFLVPHLNGQPYDHKPPALFWLIHAGWAVFGVNEWWPRLIGPLASLLVFAGLVRLGRLLWPEAPEAGRTGALLFLGTVFVAFYQTAVMFDLPLLAAIAWAWVALVHAARTGSARGWWAFGAAVGAGLLVKGPVVLVYTLPLALSLRAWRPAGAPPVPRGAVVVAVLIALAVPGLWLAAASLQGEGEYFRRLLVDQTARRVSGDMGHPRPWYWYLPFLPLLTLPWSLWPSAWRALGRGLSGRRARGGLFALIGVVVPLLVLSAVGGKQVHYLLPVLALAMLAAGRGLQDPALCAGQGARTAARAVATSLFACALLMAAVFPWVQSRYDLGPAARYIDSQQAAGRPVAYVGHYQGEFGFLGRLHAPVVPLKPALADAWVAANPSALVVVRAKRVTLGDGAEPEMHQHYKSGEMLLLGAGELVRTGSRLHEPRR